VLGNPRKTPLLSAGERVTVIREALAADASLAGRVEVATFDGLTVDFCHEIGAGFLVRGLRAIADFETELQLAHNNHQLAPDVDTVFFMTSLQHGYISSSLVKEIAMFGGDVSTMVPPAAAAALAARVTAHDGSR
jgi:pantetheine-phosphate adenylyltransferase